MSATRGINRRLVLRGMMGGSAVTVGLPLLDCFLDTNGTAMADGSKLPVVFGTWFQALGFNPGFWEPKTVGPNYENNVQFKPLDPFRNKVTIFSGLQAYTDGNPPVPHDVGPQVILSGGIPKSNTAFPSIDTLIADVVGTRTRFRSLEVACDGAAASMSRRSFSSVNASEVSPAALYTRIFGPEFIDPNAADFRPDPAVMARQSVLSVITERRTDLAQQLGAADRARLDEYFTSLREIEQQLSLQLQKPAPMESCSVASKGEEDAPLGQLVDDARNNHRLFTQLLAHAVACDQTRVINIKVSGANSLRKAGNAMTFHAYTHEDVVDAKLGYQPTVAWFQEQVIKIYADFLTIFDSFKEGPNTLLDRSMVMYSTDLGFAKIHSPVNIPVMLAGRANGRLKPGQHVFAGGQTGARVGLTAQQIMGVPVSTWGTESNRTSAPFTEIMA